MKAAKYFLEIKNCSSSGHLLRNGIAQFRSSYYSTSDTFSSILILSIDRGENSELILNFVNGP